MAANRESKLRIGISCLPTYGGSGAIATELGRKLATLGHEIHFINRAIPFRLQGTHRNISFHEVGMFTYPTFQNPPYVMSLASKMQEIAELRNLDFLHVHYALPHAVAAYLAKQMVSPKKLCVMTTLHGTDVTLIGVAPSLYAITKFSIEQSDVVTTVSEFLRERTEQEFSTRKSIHVVPNFIDPEKFKPLPGKARRGLLEGIDQKIVMHVSNFRPVKNVEAVVEVFARVRARVPAHLVFIGDGPEMSRIEQSCKELSLLDHVSFLGNQDDVQEMVAAADVFLLPSLEEGFGLAALEAMSCAVPVIATDVGGMTEVIEDGRTGFLRNPHDVEGMAELAVELLTNEDRKLEIGRAAREHVASKYHIDDVVHQYVGLYEEWACGG